MNEKFKGIDFSRFVNKSLDFKIPKLVNPIENLNLYNEREVESSKIMFDLNKDRECIDFDIRSCDMCNSNIEGTFNWFHLISKYNNKDLVICCYECLSELYTDNNGTLDEYEIYEYSRCTAYYKCKEIGNLRDKCQTGENLSYTSILGSISPVNFCETAQAGIILASHKQYEVMDKFSNETSDKLTLFDSMLKQFNIESSRQFKINLTLTVLVIILTVVNLIVATMGYISDRNNNDIFEVYKTLYRIENEIDDDTIINKIEELKNSIESNKSLNNESIEEIRLELLKIKETLVDNNKEKRN